MPNQQEVMRWRCENERASSDMSWQAASIERAITIGK
jgi:hypothetical protein